MKFRGLYQKTRLSQHAQARAVIVCAILLTTILVLGLFPFSASGIIETPETPGITPKHPTQPLAASTQADEMSTSDPEAAAETFTAPATTQKIPDLELEGAAEPPQALATTPEVTDTTPEATAETPEIPTKTPEDASFTPAADNQAYAFSDMATKTLWFFRAPAGKYYAGSSVAQPGLVKNGTYISEIGQTVRSDNTAWMTSFFEDAVYDWSNATLPGPEGTWGWKRSDDGFRGSCTRIVFADTISPIDCTRWFSAFRALTTVENLGNLNLSRCRATREMFDQCSSLTSIDMSSVQGWGQITNMDWTFSECYALKSANLSGFTTPQCASFRGLFQNCVNLETANLTGLDMITAGADGCMNIFFDGCSKLNSFTLGSRGRLWNLALPRSGIWNAPDSKNYSHYDQRLRNWSGQAGTFTYGEKVPLATASIDNIPDQEWLFGDEVRPSVSVNFNDAQVDQSIENLEVSYTNNQNVGQATATVSATTNSISFDTGTTTARTFQITKRPMQQTWLSIATTIQDTNDQVLYTGNIIEPVLVSANINGKTYNVRDNFANEYHVSYGLIDENNIVTPLGDGEQPINVGTYEATVTAAPNGHLSTPAEGLKIRFAIVPDTMSKPSAAISPLTFNGTPQTPAITLTTILGTGESQQTYELTNADYTVSYSVAPPAEGAEEAEGAANNARLSEDEGLPVNAGNYVAHFAFKNFVFGEDGALVHVATLTAAANAQQKQEKQEALEASDPTSQATLVSTLDVPFSVAPFDLRDATVLPPGTVVYDSLNHAADVRTRTAVAATLQTNSAPLSLTLDTDYTLTTSRDIVDAGSYFIDIQGVGNYTGQPATAASFAIRKKDVRFTIQYEGLAAGTVSEGLVEGDVLPAYRVLLDGITEADAAKMSPVTSDAANPICYEVHETGQGGEAGWYRVAVTLIREPTNYSVFTSENEVAAQGDLVASAEYRIAERVMPAPETPIVPTPETPNTAPETTPNKSNPAPQSFIVVPPQTSTQTNTADQAPTALTPASTPSTPSTTRLTLVRRIIIAVRQSLDALDTAPHVARVLTDTTVQTVYTKASEMVAVKAYVGAPENTLYSLGIARVQ